MAKWQSGKGKTKALKQVAKGRRGKILSKVFPAGRGVFLQIGIGKKGEIIKSLFKRPMKGDRRLAVLSVLAGVAALIAVTATIDDLGITNDEPNYFRSCIQQIAWFRQAAVDFTSSNWSAPFGSEVIDRHWNFEPFHNVHPPFYKLCSSLTLVLFEPLLGPMGAYRLAPAVMFSILVGLILLTAGRRYGLLAGFWAVAGFALMPRIFGHAHIGATDMPLTLLWFASAVSFHRALESRSTGWAVVFSLVYGLALSTKFTAFVIPLPLLLYILLSRRFSRSLRPVVIALVVSPLIMIALNPQWWHSTFERVYFYLANSVTRSEYLQIPTYYLGWKYDFYLPWHHCLVYTLFTVPPLVLAGFIVGFQHIVRKPLSDLWASHMLIHWLVLMFVMILPGSPGHDGVRLFLPSFVFLALVSAKGFSLFVSDSLPRILDLIHLQGRWLKEHSAWLLLALMMVPSAVALARIHPYELCYYNCLAGGMRGARDMGLETTYWWDPVNDRAFELFNRTFSDSAVVGVKNDNHYGFLQGLGKIKPSLKIRDKEFGYYIQYYRQGMFQEEDWVLARWGSPIAEIKKEGVRLLAFFKVPEAFYEILARLGDSNRPEALYEKAVAYQSISMPDSAFIELDRYLKIRPGDFKANMMAATYFIDRKLPDRAAGYLERAAAGRDDDPCLWYFNMGLFYFQKGKTQHAVDSFKQALKYKKLDPKSLLNLGYIYYHMGKLEESAEKYELVLRTQPDDLTAIRMLGAINYDLQKPGKARHYYNMLLEVSPGHVETLVSMGLSEHSGGNLKEAAEQFELVLRFYPEHETALHMLGRINQVWKKSEKAESFYKKLLAVNPCHVQTLVNMGMLRRAGGRPADAERFYARALDADSTDLSANFNLANLLVETGRTEQAEKHYLRVLANYPDDSQSYLALALLCLRDKSRRVEALGHFRIAARLSPRQAGIIERKYIQPLEAELGR